MRLIRTITAPGRRALHLGHGVAKTLLRVGEEVVSHVRPADDGRGSAASTAAPAPSRAAPAPAPAPTAAAEPVAPRPASAPPSGTVEPDRTEQPEFEPAHVDEEPADVVYSSADEGAVDDVGASLTVAEPWNGYRGMTVPDIVDRLTVADTATLAAVQLYEQTHRGRKGVLSAVEDRLANA